MTHPDDSQGEQPGINDDPQGEQLGGQQSVSDLSEDQLLELLSGEENIEEGNDEGGTGNQPEPPVAPAETPAAETKPPGRLSVRALPPEQQIEMAKAIEMVREGKAVDVFAALSSMRPAGTPAATPASESETPPETPPSSPQTTPEVSALEAEIADLRAQRKAAKADFDVDTEEDLTSRIEDTLMRLQEAKMEAQRASIANNEWQAQYLEAVDKLEADFPESLDDSSEFSTLLDDLLTAARARKDPGLQDPRYILTLAERVAGLLTPPASGRRPSNPPPVSRPTGRALAPAHSSINRLTVDQVQAVIRESDPDDLLEALASD